MYLNYIKYNMFKLIIIILIIICLLFIFSRPVDSFDNLEFNSNRQNNIYGGRNQGHVGNDGPRIGGRYGKIGTYTPNGKNGIDGYYYNGDYYDYYPQWYYTYPYYQGSYNYFGPLYTCSTCEGKGERECSDCISCSWCVKNGVGECIPGDANGPLFGQICDQYWHSN